MEPEICLGTAKSRQCYNGNIITMIVTSISINLIKFSYVTHDHVAWSELLMKKQKHEVIGDVVNNNELLVVII